LPLLDKLLRQLPPQVFPEPGERNGEPPYLDAVTKHLIRAVQARLGHSSPSFTMAVYAHVSPQMDKDAAQAYAKTMR
jgi:hypothetical protein